MKKFVLTFFILTAAVSGVFAQGNRSSAIIITGQENQAPAVPAEPEQQFFIPRLYWEGINRSAVARQMKAGERITLVLRAAGWNELHPQQAFFMPEVPQNVILASPSVSAEERFNGIVIKLTLIPLKEGEFVLPARVLVHGTTRFEIPELYIQIITR
ncbi:MAG: hypothetical protein FWC22_00865 [Treponema sp.]|nr:hypothetical protein [Treponema sp.]